MFRKIVIAVLLLFFSVVSFSNVPNLIEFNIENHTPYILTFDNDLSNPSYVLGEDKYNTCNGEAKVCYDSSISPLKVMPRSIKIIRLLNILPQQEYAVSYIAHTYYDGYVVCRYLYRPDAGFGTVNVVSNNSNVCGDAKVYQGKVHADIRLNPVIFNVSIINPSMSLGNLAVTLVPTQDYSPRTMQPVHGIPPAFSYNDPTLTGSIPSGAKKSFTLTAYKYSIRAAHTEEQLKETQGSTAYAYVKYALQNDPNAYCILSYGWSTVDNRCVATVPKQQNSIYHSVHCAPQQEYSQPIKDSQGIYSCNPVFMFSTNKRGSTSAPSLYNVTITNKSTSSSLERMQWQPQDHHYTGQSPANNRLIHANQSIQYTYNSPLGGINNSHLAFTDTACSNNNGYGCVAYGLETGATCELTYGWDQEKQVCFSNVRALNNNGSFRLKCEGGAHNNGHAALDNSCSYNLSATPIQAVDDVPAKYQVTMKNRIFFDLSPNSANPLPADIPFTEDGMDQQFVINNPQKNTTEETIVYDYYAMSPKVSCTYKVGWDAKGQVCYGRSEQSATDFVRYRFTTTCGDDALIAQRIGDTCQVTFMLGYPSPPH